MNSTLLKLLAVASTFGGIAFGQAGGVYSNFIRQVQLPSGVQWDASVVPAGESLSALPIDLGGARFELWTMLSMPAKSFLLDTRTVGAYMPVAEVTIRSEDPYAEIPRTRADRPFFVDVTVTGILTGVTDPAESKGVKLLRHVQSYGEEGTGQGIDRTQATLLNQAMIVTNGPMPLNYALNSVPGPNRTKVRGEERFSVYSLSADGVPEAQIASRFIQVWPLADATISGIVRNQKIRFKGPDISVSLNDLYPSSRTYTQLYKGAAASGVTGKLIPDASVVVNDTVPVNGVLSIKDYDEIIDEDGIWTMEVLTETPFGTDRLAFVTFSVNRKMELNGTFTTIE